MPESSTWWRRAAKKEEEDLGRKVMSLSSQRWHHLDILSVTDPDCQAEVEESSWSMGNPSYSRHHLSQVFSPLKTWTSPSFTGNRQLRLVCCKPTSCSVNPIATRIALGCQDVLLPVLVNIINSSLHSSIVPKPLKTAVIKPLLGVMSWLSG